MKLESRLGDLLRSLFKVTGIPQVNNDIQIEVKSASTRGCRGCFGYTGAKLGASSLQRPWKTTVSMSQAYLWWRPGTPGFDGWVQLVREEFETEDHAISVEVQRLRLLGAQQRQRLEACGVDTALLQLSLECGVVYNPPEEGDERIWAIDHFKERIIEYVPDEAELLTRLREHQHIVRAMLRASGGAAAAYHTTAAGPPRPTSAIHDPQPTHALAGPTASAASGDGDAAAAAASSAIAISPSPSCTSHRFPASPLCAPLDPTFSPLPLPPARHDIAAPYTPPPLSPPLGVAPRRAVIPASGIVPGHPPWPRGHDAPLAAAASPTFHPGHCHLATTSSSPRPATLGHASPASGFQTRSLQMGSLQTGSREVSTPLPPPPPPPPSPQQPLAPAARRSILPGAVRFVGGLAGAGQLVQSTATRLLEEGMEGVGQTREEEITPGEDSPSLGPDAYLASRVAFVGDLERAGQWRLASEELSAAMLLCKRLHDDQVHPTTCSPASPATRA